MHGFGFGPGRHRRKTGPAPKPALVALTLSSATIAENSAPGTIVGTLAGKTTGSALSLAVDAGGRFALSGNALIAGLVGTDFETATSHSVTVREALAGSPNSPRDTVLTVAVTNQFEKPNLAALSLSATAFVVSVPTSGTILGATTGSAIAATGLPSGLTVDGAARTWAWSGAGSAGTATVVLTETLADSANSPRASSVGISITAPQVAPGYLSNVVAPYAAYGAQRVVSGYAGNLFQLRRASDGATLNVAAQSGGDYPDYAAIVAWAAGSALTVPTIYDQTGNGRHLTQATVANQPSFDPTAKTGNCAPILIDGYARSTATGLPAVVAKTPTVTGLALDVIANSAFICAAPITTFNSGGLFEWQDNTAASQQAMHYNAGGIVFRTTGTNETSTGGTVPRAQLDVFGGANGPTQSVIWANGLKRTTGHTKTTVAVDRIKFGASAAGGSAYNGTYKLFSAAFYNSTLSNANGDAIEASLKTAHGYSASFPYRVVFAGDSIMEGSGALQLKNMVNQLGLTKNAELFNMGVHGQTLATEQAGQVGRFGGLFTASYPCVIFIEGGTNDIHSSGTTGAALYTTASSFVTYLKGLGFKVVHCTLLPQTNSVNWSAAKETERLAYNTAVRGNAAGADLVLDLASDATMGDVNAPLDTAKYCDKIHPTTAGYGYLAPLYKAALQTVLRTTALGGSYVP